MHPIPCNHCGNNFMRHNLDVEAPRLCNNCEVRENLRNPKREVKMSVVSILIQCPKEVQIEIEELCMINGTNFSQYFLSLHENAMKRNESPVIKEKEEIKVKKKAVKK